MRLSSTQRLVVTAAGSAGLVPLLLSVLLKSSYKLHLRFGANEQRPVCQVHSSEILPVARSHVTRLTNTLHFLDDFV